MPVMCLHMQPDNVLIKHVTAEGADECVTYAKVHDHRARLMAFILRCLPQNMFYMVSNAS
jgi:hypothetical protein